MTIIVVGTGKGGVGKTLLATNLASIAAHEDIDFILLDTDTSGNATSWCKNRKEAQILPEISTLAVPTNAAKAVVDLAKKYSLVIIDIGAGHTQTMLECCTVADLILIPTGPDQYELEETTKAIKALRQIEFKHKRGLMPITVLLNQVSTNSKSQDEADMRAYLEPDNVRIMKSVLRSRTSWKRSRKVGCGAHELRGREADHKATAEMKAVFDEAERLVEEFNG